MTQINVIGNILGSSGYDVHTRNLANALSKITDVRLSTTIQPGQEALLADRELEMIKKPDKGEINLIITSPLFWRLHTNAKRNWAFFVWEGDRVPRHFIEECLNPDIEYIFVPSEHTRDAIYSTLEKFELDMGEHDKVYEKIKVISHGVDLGLFYPKQVEKERFTFVLNKGFRNLEDRGGTQYAIQAYLEEFTGKDNVELIVKINPAYGIPNIQQLINEIKPKDKTDFGMVNINTDNIPYNILVDLYNKGNVFVMPTRAESFGIPGIESMACGVPIITSSFGGQTDYANKDNSWIIGGELTEIVHEVQYENTKWLTPSIPELRKAMREAHTNKELLKEKGEKSLETSKKFTWDSTALKVKKLI